MNKKDKIDNKEKRTINDFNDKTKKFFELCKIKYKEIKEKIDYKIKNTYIEYPIRILIFGLLFVLSFSISYFFVINSFHTEEAKSTSYRETGTSDYRVYLHPNEFYEQPYLGKGKVYISSIIKSINIDFTYQFLIDELIDMDFNYSIMGKLSITDDTGSNVFYEKDYTLLSAKKAKIENNNRYNLKEKVSIDYAKYNNIANSFKTAYGVDAKSNFIVYLKINKNASELNINSSSKMSVTIPLSQRAISISVDNGDIGNTNTITTEEKTTLDKKIFIVFAVIFFIASVAALLKFLELLFGLITKKTAYDRLIDKIFKEYDRLIVETKTMPNFDNNNIIKIDKFEELLDARDTLKQPIMYFNVSTHNKCYFYIKNNEDIYLTIIKAVDLEESKNEKKKK